MNSDPTVKQTDAGGKPAPGADPSGAQQQQQPDETGRPAPNPMLLLRRPNRQAVLKNRSRESQEEIMEYLEGTATKPRHSLMDTVAWLTTRGVKTSYSALRDFRDWWELARQLGTEFANQLERECYNVPETGLAETHSMRKGQTLFEEQSVRDRDSKLFLALQRTRQRERALELQQIALQMRQDTARKRAELAERKLECRERLTDLAIWKAQTDVAEQKLEEVVREEAVKINSSRRSNAEKIEALRKTLFARIDELEASGTVIIPPADDSWKGLAKPSGTSAAKAGDASPQPQATITPK